MHLKLKTSVGKKNPYLNKYLIIYCLRSGPVKKAWTKIKVKRFFKRKKLKFYFFVLRRDINKYNLNFFYKKIKFNRIVVVGGDGSLRQITEYFYFKNVSVPYIFIPKGSANVFARSLGIPLNTKEALLKGIKGRIEKIDIGLINNKKAFLIAACFGKISEVTLAPTRRFKKRFGFYAYAFKLFKLFRGFKKYPVAVRLEDKKLRLKKAHSVMICNHLNVHSLKPKRTINYNDGRLDLFIFSTNNAIGLLIDVFKFYLSRGDSQDLKQYSFIKVKLNLKNLSNRVHLDGDKIIFKTNKFFIKTVPSAITIIK